jgi:hypothetical protein
MREAVLFGSLRLLTSVARAGFIEGFQRSASYTHLTCVVAVAANVMHGLFQACCRKKEWRFGGKLSRRNKREAHAAVSVNGADLK